MKKRSLLFLGVLLLAMLATLILWQGSFTFGEYAPSNPIQTFVFWAVSTLVFLLTVMLGFMLFRTGVKLYIERQSHREGSRIRTKLVVGALALSFLPVFFLVIWSVYVLNRNLDKWFSRPAEGVRLNLVEIDAGLRKEALDKVTAQAYWLAAQPEARDYLTTGNLEANTFEDLCSKNNIAQANIERSDGVVLPLCGTRGQISQPIQARASVSTDGDLQGTVVVEGGLSLDLAEKQRAIQDHVRAYDQLAIDKKSTRNFYLQLLALITLFVLFVATWIALFLAQQINVPISALLAAADKVRKGDLGHRIRVKAIDELATLVRSFNEMTEELEANSRELAMRNRFTEAILESIPTGFISLSAQGTILKVNRALKQIFPPEKVAHADRLEDLFSSEDTAEIKYLMNRARRTGVASRQMEFKAEQHTMHLSVTVAALEEDVTSGFVLVLEDTSDLLRAQKATAWHEVARRIAHEIKNPLTPIALCADRINRQLERGTASPDYQRILQECATTIAREVLSVKTLVDEFSQFARFPAAQPVPTDLSEVVEEALNVFSDRLDGIEIRKDLAQNLALVHVDREQFKRVIVNLVDNAAEAMRGSLVKQLYLATRMAGIESVELIIEDTGCGISPGEKEKLFLPYFSTKGRGTGLGLAIVNHILTEHSAHIQVEDNTPVGARFRVEVPCLERIEGETKSVESPA